MPGDSLVQESEEKEGVPLKKTGRIIVAFSLALILIISGSGPVAAAGENGSYYPAKEHEQISLKNMDRELFDEETFSDAVSELKRICKESGQEAEVGRLYRVVLEQTDRLQTEAALSELDYYCNMNDEEAADRCEEVSVLYTDMMDEAAIALRELLNSEYGDVYREEMGEYNALAYQNYEELTEEMEDLLDDYQELIFEYEDKVIEEYGSAEDKNQVLGEIFLQLVQIRTEMAGLYGYDNYADYAYESVYYRDYTVKDAENLRGEVKETLVPFFYSLVDQAVDGGVNEVFEEYSPDSSELLEMIAPYMEQLSEDVGEAFTYFQEQQLYDLDYSEDKINMAYTIELPSYGAAYIFDNRYDCYLDVLTVIHEFGHFNSIYHDPTPTMYINMNMDVSEIHSQGLEMLFYPYYEEIYPEKGAAMQYYVLYEMLCNILLGCALDEVENTIYRNPDMTLEEINELMIEKSMEYGIDGLAMDADSWVEITQLFEQPFYMISYTVSALTALDLFRLSQEDQARAVDCYLQISALATAEPYCAVLEACGLEDFFRAGTVAELADDLEYLLGNSHETGTGPEGSDSHSWREWMQKKDETPWADSENGLQGGSEKTESEEYRKLALSAVAVGGAAAVLALLYMVLNERKNGKDEWQGGK